MDSGHIVRPNIGLGASVDGYPDLAFGLTFRNLYRFECFDRDGLLKWVEEVPNLVTDQGANDLLTQYLKGAAYTAAWFVGLVDNAGFTAYAASDTSAAHAGWTESTAYSNANRPALTLGAAAGRSINNSAAKAVFNINAPADINGGFITSSSTKGGAAGILYGEAIFNEGVRTGLRSGDTLSVTATLQAN